MIITASEKEKKGLAQVFATLRKACLESKLPSQLLWEMDDYGGKLLAPIFKIDAIRQHFDHETVIEFIDIAFAQEEAGKPTQTVEVFLNVFTRAHDEWIGLFPLNFSSMFQFVAAKKRRGKVSFSEGEIVDPFSEVVALESYLNKRSKQPVRQGLVAHQARSTKNTILDNPLLAVELSGTEEIVRGNGIYHFKVFRWLLDFYLAVHGEKSELRDVRQSPAHWFLILDVKSGELTRHNLHFEGDQVLALWDKDKFRCFLRKDFDLFYRFLLDSRSDLRLRLHKFLNFFSRCFHERDSTMKLLTAVIALEALFSRSPDSPIKAYLAETSAALTKRREEKMKVYEFVRKCYDQRSKIVHTGAFQVSYDDAKETETVFSKIALEAMHLILDVANRGGGEKEFFAAILDKKIGH